MSRDKDLKRLIRARMEKTGEAYTTARARIVEKRPAAQDPEPPAPATNVAPAAAATASQENDESATAPAPADYATLAGVSETALTARTGRGWAEWVQLLDAANAAALPHRDIAALLHDTHGVDAWWAQSVTVGYERIRGLRDRGQRRGGTYEAAKTRTFPVDVGTLFEACADPAQRSRWLDEVDVAVRAATPARSMRLDWPDGTRVTLWFTAKGDAKSSVSVQHEKLQDRAAVERMKAFWGERMAALAEMLAAS